MTNNWTIMVYISADDVLANFAIDSLNQFRRAASNDGDEVVALFDPNDGSDKTFQYRIDSTNKEKTLSEIAKSGGPRNMADPQTLTDFVKSAIKPPGEPKGRHYCLILWGHGTELLLDRDPGTKGKRYLTPAKLKIALKGTGFDKDNKLDFVAFDACSMSMVEVASALQDHVHYMIASQNEVPDVSFPYQRILERLKGHGGSVEEVCRLIPEIYLESFQDYLVTARNGVQEIMLSSLNLEKVKNITDPVSKLAKLLLPSASDHELGDAIVLARRRSRDFVLGLFVDICDFCEKLPIALDETGCQKKAYSSELKATCDKVCRAIRNKDYVIANKTRKDVNDCHGVSIYFPYSVQKDETEQTKRLLGDGETGILHLPLVKGGTGDPRKARNVRIEELEADFQALPFFKDDGWGNFIKRGWSVVLARTFPYKMDLHYSAEQVAQNLSAALRDAGTVSGEVQQLRKQNEELTTELERLALKPGA